MLNFLFKHTIFGGGPMCWVLETVLSCFHTCQAWEVSVNKVGEGGGVVVGKAIDGVNALVALYLSFSGHRGVYSRPAITDSASVPTLLLSLWTSHSWLLLALSLHFTTTLFLSPLLLHLLLSYFTLLRPFTCFQLSYSLTTPFALCDLYFVSLWS